jgi:hypothetical protein
MSPVWRCSDAACAEQLDRHQPFHVIRPEQNASESNGDHEDNEARRRELMAGLWWY